MTPKTSFDADIMSVLRRLSLSALACLFAAVSFAQSYEYTLSWDDAASHRYVVELTADREPGPVTVFELPAWRPGRYIMQEYAAAVTGFRAEDERGNALDWRKTGSHAWQVSNPSEGRISISYRLYANVLDAGSSYLAPGVAYFNGVNLFMHVRGRLETSCTLHISSMPETWKAATALRTAGAYNRFAAETYHDLIDAPTVIAPSIKTLEREVDGVRYVLHFYGTFLGDEEVERAMLEGVERIARVQSAVFGETPFDTFHYIYYLVPFGRRHAVEHKESAMFVLPETVTASVASLPGSFLGITSHELWHVWNVKRLRPAALWPYDYQTEQYTRLHWFTEGVTEYYARLTLVRAGILSEEAYLGVLGGIIGGLENSEGTELVSPSKASFDSWLAGSDYADPDARASYYSLGARLGLLIDLRMRAETDGRASLDGVFRLLYERYYKRGLGMPEEAVREVIEELTGSDWGEFFARHVEDSESVDYEPYLGPFGLALVSEIDTTATHRKIGLDGVARIGNLLYVTSVRPGSDAAAAGFKRGDLITQIQGVEAADVDMEALFMNLPVGALLRFLVFSDGVLREQEVAFSGRDMPRRYRVVERGTVTDVERALREGWIGWNSEW